MARRILAGLLFTALLMTTPRTTWAQAPSPLLEQTPRIALDPGHGGRDFGARGPTGLLEKDACLALARNLALRLESRCKVILTRGPGAMFKTTLDLDAGVRELITQFFREGRYRRDL